MKLFNKKVMIASGMLCVSLATFSAIVLFNKSTHVQHNSYDIYLEDGGWIDKKEYTKKFPYYTEKETVYHVSSLPFINREKTTISITERTLPNNDTFSFIEAHQFKDGQQIKIEQKKQQKDFKLHENFDSKPSTEHHPLFGVNKLTSPIGWFQGDKHQVISKSYYYKTLHDKQSTVRELIKETNDLSYDTKGFTQKLSLNKGQSYNQWILSSNEPFFSSEKTMKDWLQYSIKDKGANPIWFAKDGNYTKLAWSIAPFTKDGYGRSVSLQGNKKALDWYHGTKERYLYDIAMNSIGTAHRNTKNGLYKTEYTSTALRDYYKIEAPYMDTRHNEVLSIIFQQASKHLSLPILDHSLENYGDYLLEQEKKKNIQAIGPNLLISDYDQGDEKPSLTHVALNHALGEMNFLYKVYDQTKNEKYLELAHKMKRAIESTKTEWIRDNGDLWYKRTVKGTYEGNDYPVLTLEDLANSQSWFMKIDGKKSPEFEELILSKLNYVTSNNIELFKSAVNKIKEIGLGHHIEDYKNIRPY